MKTGDRIKQLRESLGITQNELAIYLETTKQTIYKYENNIVTNIPIDKIERLAVKLKTTPAYLTGWDDEGKNIEFSIFEELLSISNWEYKAIAGCDIQGANSWLDEKDQEPCPCGKNYPDDCIDCEYNEITYYLVNDKQCFQISEKEFNELCYCIKPYFNLRVSELVSKKLPMDKSELEHEE